MLAILRGEYQIAGFSNRTLQPYLEGWSSQKIGRILKRFRVLRLIKRVGRTSFIIVQKSNCGRPATKRTSYPAQYGCGINHAQT